MKSHAIVRIVAIWVSGTSLCVAVNAARAEEAKVPDPGSPEFPTYVMNKIDDQYRGAQSHGTMEMTVETKHWKRSISMESWSLGRDYSLMRILEPKKERGTATLKANKELYTYLSKTDRRIKITSDMMGGSWMGSHFTNDDLVRHTRLDNEFIVKLTFTGLESGTEVYRFDLTPKPNAAVVWGKVIITVRRADLQPLSQRFFDEKGKAVRVLTFSNHQRQGDRVMPMKMEMRPLDGSGEYTLLEWKDIDFNVKLDKSFFSLQNLKSF